MANRRSLGRKYDVADPQDGVLQMGRDDGEIFRIEGDEFQEVHGLPNC